MPCSQFANALFMTCSQLDNYLFMAEIALMSAKNLNHPLTQVASLSWFELLS